MSTNNQSDQNHLHASSVSNAQTSQPPSQETCLNIHKIFWLRSCSGLAITVSEKSRMFAGAQDNFVSDTLVLNTSARLAFGTMMWVMHWVLQFTCGRGFERFKTPDVLRIRSEPIHGRYQRLKGHMARRKSVPVVRLTSRLFRILSRHMTFNQYREFLAHMSLSGRVRVYGLKYAGSVLQRRARLICFDHGWWCMPITSAVNSGMWNAQLPPP